MQKDPEPLLQILLKDIDQLLQNTPEEFADPAINELHQKLTNYYFSILGDPRYDAKLYNVLVKKMPHDRVEADDDFVVVSDYASGFMYELVHQSKFDLYAKEPTPVSEIIAFYFFLKNERYNPASKSRLYKNYIDRAFDHLVRDNSTPDHEDRGAIAYLVNRLPKTKHVYQKKLRTKIRKEQAIERHLFFYGNEPIEKLEEYIDKRVSASQLDAKLTAARNILQKFYQLPVICYYNGLNSQQTFEHMKDIIVSTTRSVLSCELVEINNSYRALICDILSYMDKMSAKHLSHPTHYRGLVTVVRFDERSSNKVTHFSESHFAVAHSNRLQLFNNAANDEFAEQGAYYEIMSTLESAEKFIFILGWEISPQLKYFHKNHADARTLGEILADKAFENPNLLIAIMVWAQTVPIIGNIGAQTHVDSLKYLNDLCEKRHGKPLPVNLSLQFANRPGLWLGANTHHQKMVVADTGAAWPFIRAFYGGLDLTTGRFDYNHELLLQNDYLRKYHQTRDLQLINQLPNDERPWTNADICNLDKSNPFRTPWHDIHSRVEGNVCIDLMEHFRQHWAANSTVDLNLAIITKMRAAATDFMKAIKPELLSEFIWKSQILRSHTSASCNFWRLDSHYENSIMGGYIKLINAAERFIYIENQYFIGGGKHVHNQERVGNLIPNAIANKIIAKHHAREDFHVYIVLPLFPEDGPESNASNEVRRNQHDTMHWLLTKVNKHTDNRALDYVSFLWLGEWNGKLENYDALAQNFNTTREQLITASRRYPIYVHSKFMIVDDKYVINGSANINERSMMGIRDSEIAIVQGPEKGKEAECQAMLLAFRRQLWQQYFGTHCLNALGEEGIVNPHTGPAVATIQHYARIHLRSFIENDDGRQPGQGHLMVFPYHAAADLRPQLVNLPDTPRAYEHFKAFRWLLDKDNVAPGEHISTAGKFMQKYIGPELL